MSDPDNVSALRTRITQALWHTEELRSLGLEDSYRESQFLGESLQSQLDEALANQGSSTNEGG